MTQSILIAGIGNIFFGDDAFGCEVIRELIHRELPECVTAIDFGIRGYDLAYAIADDFDTVILVDAAPPGDHPGAVTLQEIDAACPLSPDSDVVQGHSLTPARVLQLIHLLGADTKPLYLVSCEAAELGDEDGQFELSDEVHRALPIAIMMIEQLVADLLNPHLAPVSMS